MQLNSYYQYYTSALSKDLCEELIDFGNKTIKKNIESGINTFAHTHGNQEKQSKPNSKPINEKSIKSIVDQKENIENYYVRDSQIAWLNDDRIFNGLLPYVNSANTNAGWNYEILKAEDVQFTVYNSPGGFYGWHQDSGSDIFFSRKQYIEGISPPKTNDDKLPDGYTKNNSDVGLIRKISVTVNLSTEGSYEGGNLKFDWGNHARVNNQYHECVEIRPQGSIIVFPSHLYHCVTPVTKGTRYSLVMWCLGRPFK
jgi:PKHD-type hydroxylase